MASVAAMDKTNQIFSKKLVESNDALNLTLKADCALRILIVDGRSFLRKGAENVPDLAKSTICFGVVGLFGVKIIVLTEGLIGKKAAVLE
eukprot:3073879-Ditylum_brightwellii.AAC.1